MLTQTPEIKKKISKRKPLPAESVFGDVRARPRSPAARPYRTVPCALHPAYLTALPYLYSTLPRPYSSLANPALLIEALL